MSNIHINFESIYTKKNQKLNIFIPNNKFNKILLLLHGYGGDEQTIASNLDLNHICNDLNCMVICPSGDNSFYTWHADGKDYYKYINEEIWYYINPLLEADLDSYLKYIGGISMGGYGALEVVTLNHHFYNGAILISGSYDIKKRDGEKRNNPEKRDEWVMLFGNHFDSNHDLFSYRPDSTIKYYIASGLDDYLHEASIKLESWLKEYHCDIIVDYDKGEHNSDFFYQHLKKGIYYVMGKNLL